MKWEKVRELYPDKWVVVESLSAHSANGYRFLDELVIVEVFTDAMAALRCHAESQKQYPYRELYFFHTSRELLDIREKKRLRFQKA